MLRQRTAYSACSNHPHCAVQRSVAAHGCHARLPPHHICSNLSWPDPQRCSARLGDAAQQPLDGLCIRLIFRVQLAGLLRYGQRDHSCLREGK